MKSVSALIVFTLFCVAVVLSVDVNELTYDSMDCSGRSSNLVLTSGQCYSHNISVTMYTNSSDIARGCYWYDNGSCSGPQTDCKEFINNQCNPAVDGNGSFLLTWVGSSSVSATASVIVSFVALILTM